MRLIDRYREDIAEQTTIEGQHWVRRYWYRAVTMTILERSITPLNFPVPKRGTHGVLVERYLGFWFRVPESELQEVFLFLKPFFAMEQHRKTDLSA